MNFEEEDELSYDIWSLFHPSSDVSGVAFIMTDKITLLTVMGGDHPGITIHHVEFRGHNYEEWARAMRLSLLAKNKFGFVDGTLT